MLKRKVPLWVLIVALIAVVSVCVGAVLYSLNIPSSMKLQASHSLELRDFNDVVITSYEWNNFTKGQQKLMGDYIAGDKPCRLHNLGNTPVNVTWSSDISPEWLLEVQHRDAMSIVSWASGVTHFIDIGANIDVWIRLTEVSAVAETPYAFTFSFDVIG